MIPELFWQEILPPDAHIVGGYPARFADGRILLLPIRLLPDGKHALASLIISQASFTVVGALAMSLTQKLAAFAPDIIVGLPTLSLTLAGAVAQKLGHTRPARQFGQVLVLRQAVGAALFRHDAGPAATPVHRPTYDTAAGGPPHRADR
jgi:hypothetical protein